MDTPSRSIHGTAFHRATSSSLLNIICAHFNPAMFQAFDVAVTVTHTCAAVSDTEAAGMWVPS